jgi:hypothetical protein
MIMNKAHLLMGLFFLFQFPLVSAQTDNKLNGTWSSQSNNETITLSFSGNNTLTYNGAEYYFQNQNNTIVINDEGYLIYYPYKFQEGSLYITFPEGYTLQFQKSNTSQTANSKQASPSSVAAEENTFLYGRLCEYGASSSYSTYSSYSHTNTLYFDGKGNFKFGSESAYSGSEGLAYTDGSQGLEFGTYTITSNQVHFRFQNGETYTMTIKMVQNNGQITELMFGEKLYASGLCD